jgi:hypothetical protein
MRSPALIVALGFVVLTCEAAGPDTPQQPNPGAWSASYRCTSDEQSSSGEFQEFWVMPTTGFYEWDTTVRITEGTTTTTQRVHVRTTRRDDRLAVLWRAAEPPPPANTYTIITPRSLYILADGTFTGAVSGAGLKGSCQVIGHSRN